MKSLISMLAALITLMTGCATNFKTSVEKSQINAVRLEPRVDIQFPLRHGFAPNRTTVTELVNSLHAKRLALVSSNMQANGIEIPEMVYYRAQRMLVETAGLNLVTNRTEADLILTIYQYGFNGAGMSFTRESPFIVLRGELLKNGKRLWKNEGRAAPLLGGSLSADTKEYQTNAKLLREHWESKIDEALRDLFKLQN